MTVQALLKQRLSLRARVTTWYVGMLGVALLVFSISVYGGIRSYLKQSLQRALTGTAQTLATDFIGKVDTRGDQWVLGEIRESYASSPTDHYIRISVDNRIFYQTGDMRDPDVSLADIALPRGSDVPAFHRQALGDEVIMTYSLPYRAADRRLFEIEAGTSLHAMQATLYWLLKVLVFTTIVILIAAAIGGFLLMKQPLRPLIVLTEKAEDIGRKELGERLPVIPTGDELERLTLSLNSMIGRLEEALAHNYRFSADASHELRTPLTIMRGEVEELLQLEDLPTQALENLVSALEEIDRMSRIVSSLMTITRLDAGGERMDLKTLNLAALARTTVEMMRLLAEEKSLPLTFRGEDPVYVVADPFRIKQVLVNLIDNAIKYTAAPDPAGPGLQHSVEVTLLTAGTHARLEIADHGVGVSAEALPFVFDRFYRADFARSRVAGGVGLGLAIVKAIVTAHEGTVSITSTPGVGSILVVELPLARDTVGLVVDTLVEIPPATRKQVRMQHL